MVSCQKCRQPLAPSSFANYLAPSSSDSLAALSPSTYDFLSASERFPPRPLYTVPQPRSYTPSTAQRVVVPSPNPRPSPPGGPAESFVVLSDSLLRPQHQQPAPPLPSPSVPSPSTSASAPSTSAAPTSLLPRLTQLSHLSALLSSSSSVDHPLCTECIELLLQLMAKELDEGKKERDRLSAFEKDVAKRRDEAQRDGSVVGREALEKDIAKLKKAEQHAIAELKSVEAQKDALEAERLALDEEEAELAREEAEFWREHSKYVLEKSALEDRSNALAVRLASGQKELDKLGRTNVYNDAFCIGQEAGFGTINGLRLGRLPGVSVEWPEINAAWGHTLLLLSTIARKFGFTFQGYRLVPCGSFSRVERTDGDRASYELYGSGDFAVTRLLQNRRFDLAMVAFLDCLRQLSEWVVSRDRSVRLPHAVVKDRIGDVSIKLQFGSDEAWTRALRHVLLDLKILLGRASI
ncbi:hypothetical protein JCM1840_007561 [Sporobolomyces johnsonii]